MIWGSEFLSDLLMNEVFASARFVRPFTTAASRGSLGQAFVTAKRGYRASQLSVSLILL